jgi:hypothetical protein
VEDSVYLGVLAGDVNRDRMVSSADKSAVAQRFGQEVGAGNFQYDVNRSGWIDSADKSNVIQRLGNLAPPCPWGSVVPAGYDCWLTYDENKSEFDFSLLALDFFDREACQPVSDKVYFRGTQEGEYDTKMERLEPIVFGPLLPSTKDIPLQIVYLSLESVPPMKVQCGSDPYDCDSNGTPDDEELAGNDANTNGVLDCCEWDIHLTLDEGSSQGIGMLTATKEHPNGGTFDSEFYVAPKFVFARLATDCNIDIGTNGVLTFVPVDPEFFEGSGSVWLHTVAPGTPVEGCGENFVPGMYRDEGERGWGNCCFGTPHEGPNGEHHCVCTGACVDCCTIKRCW